eukprot:gene35220-43430_t
MPGKFANLHQLKSFVPIVLHETVEIRSEIDRRYSVANELISMSPRAADNARAATYSKDLLSSPKSPKKLGFTEQATDSQGASALLNDVSVS